MNAAVSFVILSEAQRSRKTSNYGERSEGGLASALVPLPRDLDLFSRRKIGRCLGIKIGHRRGIKFLVPFVKAMINSIQPVVRRHAFVQNGGVFGRGEAAETAA